MTQPTPEAFEGRSEQEILGGALSEVARTGATHIDHFLPPHLLTALDREVEQVPLEPRSGQYKRAEQRLSSAEIEAPFKEYPAMAILADALGKSLRMVAPDVAGVESYQPNRIGINQYPPGEIGITPHLDEGRFGFLVATLTISGQAEFSIVADRAGQELLATWETKPGSLVLLRAPGFDGVPDGRVLHQVTGGRDGHSRTSLVYRMATR